MFVYRSGEAGARPVVLFEYQPGRRHEHPERFLKDYVGGIMTDGYSAWRMLGGLKHLGCLAHIRRKFDEALKAQKQPRGRAKEALDMIGKLYHIQAMARKKALPDGLTEIGRIYQWRHEKSRPILSVLHACLVKNHKMVMPQSSIGKAIRYALANNNIIERDIRPWLFANSVPGADGQ